MQCNLNILHIVQYYSKDCTRGGSLVLTFLAEVDLFTFLFWIISCRDVLQFILTVHIMCMEMLEIELQQISVGIEGVIVGV